MICDLTPVSELSRTLESMLVMAKASLIAYNPWNVRTFVLWSQVSRGSYGRVLNDSFLGGAWVSLLLPPSRSHKEHLSFNYMQDTISALWCFTKIMLIKRSSRPIQVPLSVINKLGSWTDIGIRTGRKKPLTELGTNASGTMGPLSTLQTHSVSR